MKGYRALLALACGTAFHVAAAQGVAAERAGTDYELQTDRSNYVARTNEPIPGPFTIYEFKVDVRFRNRTDRTAYLKTCAPDTPRPVYQVGYAGDVPATVAAPAYLAWWSCAGHIQHLEVAAGAGWEGTLTLRGSSSWGGVAGQSSPGALEGDFQLRFFVLDCQSCYLSGTPVLSNRFRVDKVP